jgi:ribosome-associated protein
MERPTGLARVSPDELRFEFFRSSGPGGQNVNKVATAVRLRFDVRNSPSLPSEVRERLLRLVANRLTDDGVLLIEARRFRTQERNRDDAVERLLAWIAKAWEAPRRRRATKPTKAAKQRRLDAKKRRSTAKRERRPAASAE